MKPLSQRYSKAAGYRTGIFGKWHLGDNYPMRPQDLGFDECLVLKGGGISQPSDLPGGSSYFDPVLLHNGKIEKFKGYCTDVFAGAASDFIAEKSDKPFFTYLAFNCPHGPLEVADADWKPYREMNLALSEFPKTGFPITGKYSETETAKIYGMVSNIDANLGRLFKKLDEAKLAQDTIVIFLTDNGPQQPRYNAGFRGRKMSVYEGGIRVPCYVRWPGKLSAGKKVDTVSAHIDLLPTFLEACQIPLPRDLKVDGKSVLPLLKGEKTELPDRHIVTQWHRGDKPELYRNCMIRGPRYKLVQPEGVNPETASFESRFELFDILNDPYEQTNLARKLPDIVRSLNTAYEKWFKDVSSTRGFAPPRIHLGNPKENPSLLTRQDWRGPNAGWAADSEGFWEVFIDRPGKYRITLHVGQNKEARKASARIGGKTISNAILNGTEIVLEDVKLEKGDTRLEAWIEKGKSRVGVRYLEVEWVGE